MLPQLQPELNSYLPNCLRTETRSRAHATTILAAAATASAAARMDLVRGAVIGRGSSATVSLAVDRRTGAVFAVKSVGADREAELRREQSILRGLSSPYVVRCLEADGSGGGGCEMLMEYAPGGSLADEIRRCGGRCEEALIRSRARDVLRGLAHAHAAGVAHCDVKSRNVLVGADGRAVLADFGCARRVAAAGGIAAPRGGGGGTPMFMAPEAARGEEQGTAADVWAVGCTVIEMATGGPPWPQFASPVAALHHVAVSGEVPEFPWWLSDEGKDFLGRCLRRDPRERWTAEQLLEHQFVAAASSSSNSMPEFSIEKGVFVSPKSVLDQALWDDDTTADTDSPACPTERIRALAAGAPALPDWTWDANWIAVHSVSGNGDDASTMSPEVNTDSDTVRSSALAWSVTAPASSSHASQSHAADDDDDCYDDGVSSSSSCNVDGTTCSCHGNHVIISDCSPAIQGNGFIRICFVTFVPQLSWPITPFLMPLLFLPFGTSPRLKNKTQDR